MIFTNNRFPLWLRYLVMNLAAVLLLLYKGQFRSDRISIISAILAFALINFLSWISSRHYKEWK